MLPPKIDEIKPEHLDALVGSAEEGLRFDVKCGLDLKPKLHIDGPKGKLLKHVAGLANAEGGDILYGVDEKDGLVSEIVGLPDFNPDQNQLGVQDLLRQHIDPPIPGVRVETIRRPGADPVLLIRVPRSVLRPHMVSVGNSRRFYKRVSKQTPFMSAHEIRTMFAEAGSLWDRARQWRLQRIAKLRQRKGQTRLEGNNLLVLHFVPIDPIDRTVDFDLSTVFKHDTLLMPVASNELTPFWNFDGAIVKDLSEVSCKAYTQVFRDGSIEMVNSVFLRKRPPAHIIVGKTLEPRVVGAADRVSKFYAMSGMSSPLAIGLTLVNMKGAKLESPNHPFNEHQFQIDDLVCMEAQTESADFDAQAVMERPIDQLWNACNIRKSPFRDDEGKWTLQPL